MGEADFPIPGKRHMTIKRRRQLRAFFGIFAVMVILLGGVSQFYGVARIGSGTMSPAFPRGSLIFYRKVSEITPASLSRGLVVVYRVPDEQLTPQFKQCGGMKFVNRIIALPGDVLFVNNGMPIVVNGHKIYSAKGDPLLPVMDFKNSLSGRIVVPKDRVMCVADKFLDSLDSRAYGLIPLQDIVGIVISKPSLPESDYWSEIPNGRDPSTTWTQTIPSKTAGKDMPSGPETWASDMGMEFVLIPAGEFMMGSEDGADEKPIHKVEITQSFYMGKFEVTNAEYRLFNAGRDSGEFEGSSLNGDRQPVAGVSWDDAQAFCEWLNDNWRPQGWEFRLPTEEQWEYAARGSDGRKYPWGNEWDGTRCNWLSEGSPVSTPVGMFGQRGESAFGIADMAGNVWEWCEDRYRAGYGKAGQDSEPQEEMENRRVLRGGSWGNGAAGCRSAIRYWGQPSRRDALIGFRILMVRLPAN